jgi:biopolymer transport protein ExbD
MKQKPPHRRLLRMRILALTLLVLVLCASTILHSTPIQSEIPPGAIVIRIESGGLLKIGNERIEFLPLTERLRALSSTTTNSAVVISPAADVEVEDVVRIVEAAKKAGIERVGILRSQTNRSKRPFANRYSVLNSFTTKSPIKAC